MAPTALFIILTAGLAFAMTEPLERVTPPGEIHGWRASGKSKTYSRDTIYDYLDGAGEIYLAYDFRRLLVQRYGKTKSPEIVLEVFDMGSSEDAFGIFSHGQGRQEDGAAIGEDSEYRGGLLCFWKGRFFVCIRTDKETPPAKSAVLALGRAIAKSITQPGERPALLNYLPGDGLIQKSLRYFHNHEILNYHYFLADKNILNLGSHAKALLVQYRDDRGYLLLAEYQNPDQASEACERFMSSYMPELKTPGAVKTENNKWTAVRQLRNFVIIVFDSISRDTASARIDAVERKLR